MPGMVGNRPRLVVTQTANFLLVFTFAICEPLAMTTHPSPPSYVMAFREWFGLTRAQAELLLALYDAHGELMTSRDLAAATGVAAGSVPFHLVDIRAALEAEGLDTERGKGYRLTEEGLDECRSALVCIGEELRLAG